MIRIYWRGLPNASWARAAWPHKCRKCGKRILPITYGVILHSEEDYHKHDWYCSVACATGEKYSKHALERLEKDPITAFRELCEEFDDGWSGFSAQS